MKNLIKKLSSNCGYFVLTLFVGVIFSGVSVLTPILAGNMITAFANHTTSGTLFVLLYLTVGLCQILFSWLDNKMSLQFQSRQKRLMRKNVFEAFSHQDTASKEKISEFISFVNNDIPALVDQYFTGTIDIVKCLCILSFSTISLLTLHWILALIVLAISALIVLCPKAMQKRSAKARVQYSASLGKYNANLLSFLGGLRIIKSYRYHPRANNILELANADVAQKETVLIHCKMNLYALTSFLQVGKTLLVLIVGVFLIAKGQIEIGGLITVIQLSEMIAAPAEVLAYTINARNEVVPLLDQYDGLTSHPEAANSAALQLNTVDSITIDNLSYTVDGIQILRNICVRFDAKKNYLVTGESGSGKSTLLRLISQIGDLSYIGSITYNSKNPREYSPVSFYARICPVFQEAYLFHATLEENILLGRAISTSDYNDILRKLNLEYLLERYAQTELTPELLEQLSGGEKQRVALARAMVGKPDVYLLDEVTSALDHENSERIERLLLQENAMVIHICHKANPELTEQYDEKFMMKQGRLYLHET